MAIIQKRAEDLKPGDVLRTKGMNDRVVLAVTDSTNYIGTHTADLGAPSHQYPVPPMPNMRDTLFDVVVPDARVTDEELDALLAAGRVLVGMIDSGGIWDEALSDADHASVTATLQRLRPSEPPTLAEALDALLTSADYIGVDVSPEDIDGNAAAARARDVLNRARRAGLLP
jgi:hypothetical protein